MAGTTRPSEFTEMLNMRVSPEFLEAVERYRVGIHPDLDRSAAIRDLVMAGLEAKKKEKRSDT